jgi:hypothetical protein
MATIPLNYFRRISTTCPTIQTSMYTVPTQRAGIVLSGTASNLSGSTQTISVAVSGTDGYWVILQNFPIPPNDALNIAVGKLVLGTSDSLLTSASAGSAVNFTLSVLEAVNTTS